MCYFNFIEEFTNKVNAIQPDWYVKGIIRNSNDIITLGTDSKLIGRIFELISNQILQSIADDHENYSLGKPVVQTSYPDFYFLCPDGKRIAVDIKTTYVDRSNNKNTIKYTLGSYTSYLKDGQKNIDGNYSDYIAHYVVGFIYNRVSNDDGQIIPYSKKNLEAITCPYDDVQFWVQEKYKITGFQKGSGNTANIGSISSDSIDIFKTGNGPFSQLGDSICDDYWINYDSENYSTIEKYFEWAPKHSPLKDSVNFDLLQETYIDWRKLNCPTKEDLLLDATRVYLIKGSKGGVKELKVKSKDSSEHSIAKTKKQIDYFLTFCEKYEINIDTIKG